MYSADFQPLENLSTLSDFTTTKIFTSDTSPLSADVSLTDVEMYGLEDYSEYYDDFSMEDTKLNSTTDLSLLSPSLDGDKLTDWQLNDYEVFQDLLAAEGTKQEDMQVPEGVLPPYSECEDSYEDRDLIAEAFGTSHLYTDMDIKPTDSLNTNELESKEYADLVPATVSDICAQEADVNNDNNQPKSDEFDSVTEGDVKEECNEVELTPRRRSSRNKSTSSNNGGRVSRKGKQKLITSKPTNTANKQKGRKSAKTDNEVEMFAVKPHESKKQAVRRVKNNLASRDFRSRKRSKLSDMLEQADELVVENEALRVDLASVEAVVKLLKEGLIAGARNLAQ